MQTENQKNKVEQEEFLENLGEASAVSEAFQAGAAGEADEIMLSTAELLKQAELNAQEHHDAWLRAKADADNIRKRTQVEIANAHKFAIEGFSSELLAVKDSLEAAIKVETADLTSMKNGIDLTLRQLASVFEKFNLSEIDPMGEKFDPHKHQAIGMVEADVAPNTVVNVLQKGYLLHDRVLRPALVMVAKGKAS
ncbi:MAG: nucleotide exchange factor GrpE [Betaproteobacteria bacterium CG2_30_59_46]|nr:MAG: nucleotide exchange factor GrpE [Betaproteobacteria bacterium CG2_30_59_46]PIQ13333.1 MAG: nucleotide exchange factor GrpE [Hydrogenophilales bacterium CG18_big_fil_WC_8_21_14_2_50_58_12]PIX99333.1 MAG: nucleotide exchange factor GrpE [Hydrogenophilales bacterium CG_4_10_14_3_um_filter_58_23]PJB07146.1 MAG: nucleotide exchange factor GrpE [Hydrogenophilales bacterium CG_4_9_14_3_um_filter_59_35]